METKRMLFIISALEAEMPQYRDNWDELKELVNNAYDVNFISWLFSHYALFDKTPLFIAQQQTTSAPITIGECFDIYKQIDKQNVGYGYK